ncbi:acetoacetate decarboxylase family protein [Variovorax sp. dw_308]|uniref:acetoacetate decarboxylase family protein n=1 Tax=Variovorax sp. dw_308 TaxID=2721546 RepID=UPI001C453695|nr:acetoacetate decarboxylase family protein [Variovorax sp. dw_308]
MATLPPFISWIGHGAASLAQPAVFTGARSFAFGFKTQVAATQQLVDALLNPVGGSRVHYRVLAGLSMISFMTVDRCTSQVDAIGWEPGRECALWVPLLETNHERGTLRIVLWTPYIFINYTIGLLTGRDVWGWPKVWARIAVPADSPHGAGAFTCSTTVFDTLGANTEAQLRPLLTVTSRSALPAAGATVQWTDGHDAARAIAQSLLGGFAGEHLEALIAGPTIPTVQMKQLRDSLDPGLACFQAIVDSPAQLTGFHGGGLLHASDFALEIATCESHQVVRDLLGTAPTPGQTTLPIEFAAWLAFDFTAQPGAVVVSTT